MRVWTEQKLAFWEELEREGVAYCREESPLRKEYDYAYDWLVQQMHSRLSPPPMPEIELPLWCWVQYSCYKRRKPKFSPYNSKEGYYPQVFIEADIPDEFLLQSNFYLWTWCCMNGWQIGDEQLAKEVDEYERTHSLSGHNFLLYPKDLQQRIMESWNTIFDLDYRNRRYYNRPRRNTPIQATFWLMRREWVRSVRLFIPKSPTQP